MKNNSENLKEFILKCLYEKKAENIVCLRQEHASALGDYIIVANGKSVKNIKSIAEYISLELKHSLKHETNIEGMKNSSWILLDAQDVIVHLLHPDTRSELKLEEIFTIIDENEVK